jgi:hypothetical protein
MWPLLWVLLYHVLFWYKTGVPEEKERVLKILYSKISV